MALKVIKAWKQQAIKAKAAGWPDRTCAQSACVNLATLQIELNNDPEFKREYDAAGEEAASKNLKPPTW